MEVVADAGHRGAGGNDVAEVVEQVEDFFVAHGVRILLLDARQFCGETVVHVSGRTFVDVTERVFHGILVHPNAGCKFVTAKIL